MSDSEINNKEKAFKTQLEQGPTVEHHAVRETSETAELRSVLSDIGKDLQRVGVAPKEYAYLGSFSVHVYGSEGMKGNYAFVALTNPDKCYFMLAEAAVKKLMGDVQQTYRGRFQRKRSGFANG